MNDVNLTAFVKKVQDISPPLNILDKLQHERIKSITPYGLDIDEVYERSILEQQKNALYLLDITSRLFTNLIKDVGGEMLQMVCMYRHRCTCKCLYIYINIHRYLYMYTYIYIRIHMDICMYPYVYTYSQSDWRCSCRNASDGI
jgi:hypothetical protein